MTSSKLKIVQAYDHEPIAAIDTDDAAELEVKVASAAKVFGDLNACCRCTSVSMRYGTWPA